jgi:lysophospholipase L1-like esterase
MASTSRITGPRTASADAAGTTARGGRPWRLIVAVLCYVVVLALLTFFAAHRWLRLVAVAAVLLPAASVVLNLQLRRYREAQAYPRLRLALPGLMLGFGVALVALWHFGARTDGLGFFGGCLGFLGIGQLLTEWRWRDRRSVYWGLLVVVLCAAAFFVGLRGLSAGAPSWAVWLTVSGVLVSPVGLSLLSGGALRRLDHGRPPAARTALLLAGCSLAGLTMGVFLLVAVAGVPSRYALLAGLALFLLVGAIASNTPADVLIVVAVIALAWAIAPRGVAPGEAVLPEPGETVMVAMGDSYMSGEGASQFYNGTNHNGVNECRRAPTAYAPLVVARDDPTVPDDLAFIACSGAKAVDIYERPQHPGEPIGGPVQTLPDGTTRRGLDQLDHLAWLIKDKQIKVQAVIVSVGGNDARFGEIGRSCIGPGDCTEIAAQWLQNLANVRTNLDRAYQEIRNRVGDDVPVLVVPYPVPISQTRCPGSPLTANEHRFLYGFVGQLNRVLARAAADAGLYYLDDMATALQDHHLRICDGPADQVGVNFIGVNPVAGLVEQSVNPSSWFHNSLHPNRRGHQVMADTVQAWLDRHPDLTPKADPSREAGPPRIASLEELMGDDHFRHCGRPESGLGHCGGSPNDWLLAQVAAVAGRSVFGLLLVVAGAWLLWLLLMWWWRRTAEPAVRAALGRIIR